MTIENNCNMKTSEIQKPNPILLFPIDTKPQLNSRYPQ